MNPRHSVVAVALVATLMAIIVVTSSGKGVVRSDSRAGVVSRAIGGSTPDKTASFQLMLREGDPEHESIHVFDALARLPGLAEASLLLATAELKVEYDSKAVDEADIRAALVSVGYVTPTAKDAVPLKMTASGKSQTIAITDAHGFSPNLMRAKRGVPIVLQFAPGTECRTVIRLPALGTSQDISKGGKMTLPGLKPGTYEIVCSSDATEATILVE